MPLPSRCLRKLAGLPDHLVRLEEHRRRNGETQSLRGLEVDDQCKFHGLLYWQVARFGTFQDLIDKDSSTPEHLENIGGIGHEASRLGIDSYPTDGGKPMRTRKLQDTLTVRVKHGAIHHHERLGSAAGDGLK